MPSLSLITNTFFVNLITRLGVRPPPAEGFLLQNTVQPVSIVDSDISIPAVTTSQLVDGPTGGTETVSIGAGVTLADTGPLVAGRYQILAVISLSGGAVSCVGDYRLRRRNAANSGDIWTIIGSVANAGGSLPFTLSLQVQLVQNERIRLDSINAWTVGCLGQGELFVQGPL